MPIRPTPSWRASSRRPPMNLDPGRAARRGRRRPDAPGPGRAERRGPAPATGPPTRPHVGRPVILGVRPEDFYEAPRAPTGSRSPSRSSRWRRSAPSSCWSARWAGPARVPRGDLGPAQPPLRGRSRGRRSRSISTRAPCTCSMRIPPSSFRARSPSPAPRGWRERGLGLPRRPFRGACGSDADVRAHRAAPAVGVAHELRARSRRPIRRAFFPA